MTEEEKRDYEIYQSLALRRIKWDKTEELIRDKNILSLLKRTEEDFRLEIEHLEKRIRLTKADIKHLSEEIIRLERH